MKTSTDFILTTHVGSLPRPKALEEKLLKQEMGVLSEEEAATMPAEVSDAVKWAVQRQRDMGITVIDDGEMSKYAYSTYARQRMTGLTGSDQMLAISDIMDFPEFAKRMKLEIKTPACVGPVSYLETDACPSSEHLAQIAA
jgi:5-methyltetrahydropteroyltriglutamate--homocysteine methyltransferase